MSGEDAAACGSASMGNAGAHVLQGPRLRDSKARSAAFMQVKSVLLRLRGEWQGVTYDLLQRNCCHFCEALVAELGVGPLPGWLNRLAANADATIAFTAEAVSTVGFAHNRAVVGASNLAACALPASVLVHS